MAYRADMGANDGNFRGLGLTSRRNLCLHPEVGVKCISDRQNAHSVSRSVKRKKAKWSTRDVEISPRRTLAKRGGLIREVYHYVVSMR